MDGSTSGLAPTSDPSRFHWVTDPESFEKHRAETPGVFFANLRNFRERPGFDPHRKTRSNPSHIGSHDDNPFEARTFNVPGRPPMKDLGLDSLTPLPVNGAVACVIARVAMRQAGGDSRSDSRSDSWGKGFFPADDISRLTSFAIFTNEKDSHFLGRHLKQGVNSPRPPVQRPSLSSDRSVCFKTLDL